MSDAGSLSGRSVLVVEDDFYQASDTERALRAAGAEVVGPVPRAAMALAALAGGDLDAAVVDINLGEGPSFSVADALQRAGVPFVFVTGYDEVSIPERLAHVETVQKPADMRAISRALIRVLGG
ncbi:MAG: response regulator [Caulobacter sp.]|nr:response regulator [Caulobacter sp.]